jgi:hypothetical protein
VTVIDLAGRQISGWTLQNVGPPGGPAYPNVRVTVGFERNTGTRTALAALVR